MFLNRCNGHVRLFWFLTTTDSGLRYRTIENGKGRTAKVGDEVPVYETTSYRDGTFLYSNYDSNSPVQILIGGGQAVKAIDEGLRGMRVGEVRELIAAPN